MKPTLLRDYCGTPCEGWLMSEKLDGWRAMWTGFDFVSREGRILPAPEWFKLGMPRHMLDGELFAGRGNFNLIQSLMGDGWFGLTYQVFDAPAMVAPFRKRLEFLKTLSLSSHAAIVEHVRCRDTAHLIEFANTIVDAGGEGAVIRNPKALYREGRTDDVLRWVPQDPAINRRKSARVVRVR
jgi:DNA ligase-1